MHAYERTVSPELQFKDQNVYLKESNSKAKIFAFPREHKATGSKGISTGTSQLCIRALNDVASGRRFSWNKSEARHYRVHPQLRDSHAFQSPTVLYNGVSDASR